MKTILFTLLLSLGFTSASVAQDEDSFQEPTWVILSQETEEGSGRFVYSACQMSADLTTPVQCTELAGAKGLSITAVENATKRHLQSKRGIGTVKGLLLGAVGTGAIVVLVMTTPVGLVVGGLAHLATGLAGAQLFSATAAGVLAIGGGAGYYAEYEQTAYLNEIDYGGESIDSPTLLTYEEVQEFSKILNGVAARTSRSERGQRAERRK